MTAEASQQRRRAAVYRALGEPARLAIAEALWVTDRTPSELCEIVGLEWNLLAFHLNVLEREGIVTRRRSDGDGRRRYVALCTQDLPPLAPPGPAADIHQPLFVCTHNAARSQFAAALWRKTTGRPASSAGSRPAARVHPLAVKVAHDYGLDLASARPAGYARARTFDAVISVCDRAREGGLPFAAPALHWSVPDPIEGRRRAFEQAFADIAGRMVRLTAVAA